MIKKIITTITSVGMFIATAVGALAIDNSNQVVGFGTEASTSDSLLWVIVLAGIALMYYIKKQGGK